MPQSIVTEWLNENSQRAYPLTTGSTNLITVGSVSYELQKVILDANLVYLLDFMPEEVFLTRVEISGNNVSFYITGDNSPPFVVTDVPNATFPVYVRNSQGSLLVLGEELLTLFSTNTSHEYSNVTFEPSVVSEFIGRLRGINSVTFNNHTFVGTINIKEGYQTNVQFKPNNVIYVSAGSSEGIPIGCQNFFSDEIADDCGTIVSWVNGASPLENGGNLRIVAGPHIKIFNDKDNSRIYIGLDFESVDVCKAKPLPPI
jgi:hypothetical protein